MVRVRGVRALFRLSPYLGTLWAAAGRCDLLHVMANSGWAWQLFAAPAIWIAWLRRKPCVVHYHGGEADAFFRRWMPAVRPTLARARALIVPSRYLERVFSSHGVASTVVPNVVSLEQFAPAPRRPGVPHLIVTRNLEPIYDIGTAIRAFAQARSAHPAARLTIAGSGPERASLEALAADLGVTPAVTFTGRLDHGQLPALYRSADIVVNPALVDNAPVSLIEAMASGVPIVSTRVGGIPDMVADQVTALLVPPRDAQAMAAAILRLLGDAALAERLARAGIGEAQRYAWPRVRERLLDVYAAAQSKSRVGR
jgi:glycosyltransferase involved in cell wall biosynthesis